VSTATLEIPVNTTAPAETRAAPAHLSPGAVVVSAVALGCALQVNFGQYHVIALAWLTVALGMCVLAIAAPGHPMLGRLDARPREVATAALLVHLLLLLTRSPGASGALAAGGAPWPFKAGVIAGTGLALAGVYAGARWGRACLFAVLLIHAGLGLWILRAAPDPGVDVLMFQRDATKALIDGRDPYAITFPSPYHDSSPFYAPAAVRDGRLLFGYPYPPLSLLMSLPGHLLGDVRYAQLVAMTAAGALIALARPGGPWGLGAAAVLLFTPRGFFVLEAGWTEPFAVLLLAATVFVACRRPRLVPLSLGLLIAVKQYLVMCLLLAPLLPAGWNKGNGKGKGWLLLTTFAVAAAVTLPFALWDVSAFVHSAVVLQFRQPFRADALSFLAAVDHATGWRPPAWIAFVAVIPGAVLALRKAPRTPAGFAAGVALVCFLFFAFNKQAFCNYYHFVIGALCCAAGAAERGGGSASPRAV
jgi:hypothetical protein